MSNDSMSFERLNEAPNLNVAVESTSYLVKTGENPNTFDMYSAGNNNVLKKAGPWLVIKDVVISNVTDGTASLSFNAISSFDYSYNDSILASVEVTDPSGVTKSYPISNIILTAKTSYYFDFVGLTQLSTYSYKVFLSDALGNILAKSLAYTFSTVSSASVSALTIELNKGDFSLANTTTKNSVITSGYVQALANNSTVKLTGIDGSAEIPPFGFEGLTPSAELLPNYSMVANCINNRNVLKTDIANINPSDSVGIILGTIKTNDYLNINTVMSVNSDNYRLPISAKVNPYSISCNFPPIEYEKEITNDTLSGLNLRNAIITPNRVYVLGSNSYYAEILGNGTLTGFINDLNISQIQSATPSVIKIGLNVYVLDFIATNNNSGEVTAYTPTTLHFVIQGDGSILFSKEIDLGLAGMPNIYAVSKASPIYFIVGDNLYLSGAISRTGSSASSDLLIAKINSDDTLSAFQQYQTPGPIDTQPNSVTVTETNVYIFCNKFNSNSNINSDMEVINYRINSDDTLQIPTPLPVMGAPSNDITNMSHVVQNGVKTTGLVSSGNTNSLNLDLYDITFTENNVTLILNPASQTTAISDWLSVGVVVIKNKMFILTDYSQNNNIY